MPKATPDPVLRSLGAKIRALRIEKGLSQEALAHAARLDRSYMSGIERGLRNVSVLKVARIARVLDKPLATMFVK